MNALRRSGILLSLMLGWVLAGGMPALCQTVDLTTLHAFQGPEGEHPSAVISDLDGNLYVATRQVGSSVALGTIVKISPGGALTTVYTFGGPDGNDPSSLILGTDGNLYGTTELGGANNTGTVFKLSSTGTLTTLHSFAKADLTTGSNTDGVIPEGLFEGQDGNFYGYALFGGANNDGTIFQITPAGTLTVLYTFDHNDPQTPALIPSGLTQGTDGNLYGTTEEGGVGPWLYGTVYKLTLTGTYTLLHAFSGPDGISPGYLMQAADGNIYGCTRDFAPHNPEIDKGTIFKITPNGTFTSLHAFQGPDGDNPSCLIQDLDGNLYGTTMYGGYNYSPVSTGNGTIFTVTPTGDLTTVYLFTGGTDGAYPEGVELAPYGAIFGIAGYLGYYGFGTVFRLDTGLPAVLGDFNRDSHPDILFHNRSTGQLALWYMLNNTQGSISPVQPTQAPLWNAVAVTMLRGDQHPDILFHNPSTGRMAFWFMNNSFATDGVFISPTQDPDWKPVGMADFNGDGHPDILFAQPNTGQLALWYMNRNYLTSAVYVYPVQDPHWQVVGLGDFNGDSHPDILFQNTSTGQLVVWYMGDTNYAVDGAYVKPVPDAGWQAVGVEDFDGDGHPDILLQNTSTSQLAIWYMNNNQRTSETALAQVPDPGWKVVGAR